MLIYSVDFIQTIWLQRTKFTFLHQLFSYNVNVVQFYFLNAFITMHHNVHKNYSIIDLVGQFYGAQCHFQQYFR